MAIERIGGSVKASVKPYDDQVYTKITLRVEASASTPMASLEKALETILSVAETEQNVKVAAADKNVVKKDEKEDDEQQEEKNENEASENEMIDDLQAPNCPPSAYMLYAINMRSRMRAECILDVSDVSKKIESMWMGLTHEGKQPYLTAHEAAYKVYLEKKEAFYELKKMGKIKGAKSPYVYFADSVRRRVRDEHPNETMIDIAKRIALEWSNLTDKEKATFHVLSMHDHERYEAEAAEYSRLREILLKK